MRPVSAAHRPVVPRRRRWLPWMFGIAAIAALIAIVVKSSDAVAFARILEHARPSWLAIACVLQLATYVVHGEIWRVMGRRAGARFSIPVAAELSLAKLFIDQALPSGGLSGAVMTARALQQRGMTEAAAIATVAVDVISDYQAYVLALAIALVVAALAGNLGTLIVGSALVVAAGSIAVVVIVLRVAGGRPPAVRLLQRVGIVQRTFDVLRRADRRLVHDRRARAITTGLQLGVVLLDASTVVALVLAMGWSASPGGVFASYMVASVFRTLGILPGGLGSFEAASVLTLHTIGVPTAIGLSATLAFRGLSFWLPMLPGFVASRHLVGRDQRLSLLEERPA